MFVELNKCSGQFIDYEFTFNIFLEIFTAVLTVYIVRSTTEAEYGLAGRGKIIIVKYLTAVIVSLSYMPVIIVFLAVGGISDSIPVLISAGYFLYYFFSTFVQVVFTASFSLGFAYLISHKAAYFVAVLTSMLFMPFIQNYVRENIINADQSFLNLINIVYDETYRIRYSGFGMPFNSETILSWIITVIAAIVVLSAILLAKRCFKSKGNALFLGFMTCGVISIIPLTNQYFYNCPQSVGYMWQDIDMDSYQEPPIKVDICNTYSDDNSPVIKKYEMELITGNIVRNDCVISVDMHGNDSVKFRLDECFGIEKLLVNNQKANYSRTDGDLVITDIPMENEVIIFITYSGRMNYADGMNNKTDFCDFKAGYLSDIFAWYPKILSEQNMEQEKDFTISVEAVNSFVTNLDDATLHPAGYHTITGRQTDVFFYIGYISSVESEGRQIILPTEYKNKERPINVIIQLFGVGFLTREGKFSPTELNIDNDYYSTLSDEEIFELLDEQNEKKWASDEQIQAVDTVLVVPISYDMALTSYIYENYCFICEYSIT